jgi:hypothetical protein
MRIVIWPVAKNPAMGRFGPEKWQDWYRTCVKAVDIQRARSREGETVFIAVVSAARVAGHKAEVDYLVPALQQLRAQNIVIEPSSYETVGELEAARAIARREDAQLIVVSTFGHYPRLAWLLRGIPAGHHIAFGLPRWRELVTDTILSLLFPFIDLAGKREWFVAKVTRRRQAGKH